MACRADGVACNGLLRPRDREPTAEGIAGSFNHRQNPLLAYKNHPPNHCEQPLYRAYEPFSLHTIGLLAVQASNLRGTPCGISRLLG